jgi:hypothetical protein
VSADQVSRLRIAAEPERLLQRLVDEAAANGAHRADFNPV